MKRKLIPLFLVFLFACSSGPDYSPRKINFDRDVCAMCKMGLTDQKYSVQAINNYGEVLWFDDIGCLVEMMKTDKWKNFAKDSVKIWIGDAETGKWIDATKAYYRFGDRTPMGYGYGALENKTADSLFTFDETVKRIEEGETMREEFLKEHKMMKHGDKGKQ